MSHFTPLFSARVWPHAQVLLIGGILAPGKRTISAILQVMGLSKARDYATYHRVMNRARWSALTGSRILLGLLVTLLPPDLPLVIGVDETIERRRGKRIAHKGTHRDGVRSTKRAVVRCLGLQWLSMMALLPLPFSSRIWALPFMTVLVKPARKKGKGKTRVRPPKTYMDLTLQMLKLVRRWQACRKLFLVGDGAYCAIELFLLARALDATVVARLHWNAALYDEPGVQPPGKPGPKPKKGIRQKSPKQRAEDPATPFKLHTLTWYGGKHKKRLLYTHNALWHRIGYEPVPIRYVICRDPDGKEKDDVLVCTDPDLDPEKIVALFVRRWSVEVTFEEVRAHLGFESLRNWQDKAVARTSPCILALFSIITLMAKHLRPKGDIPMQQTAWYKKDEPTFSDLLALVREVIWNHEWEKVAENHAFAYSKMKQLTRCYLYHYPLVA
jgi:hypothetical protein